MKKFLVIYLGSANPKAMDSWRAMDETTRKEKEKTGIIAWKNWVRQNSKSIVCDGGPIGKTKHVDLQGISDTKNLITGYTIVEAESHEAAAKLFENHPHFAYFPGERIEIMECLAIPEVESSQGIWKDQTEDMQALRDELNRNFDE